MIIEKDRIAITEDEFERALTGSSITGPADFNEYLWDKSMEILDLQRGAPDDETNQESIHCIMFPYVPGLVGKLREAIDAGQAALTRAETEHDTPVARAEDRARRRAKGLPRHLRLVTDKDLPS